MTDSECTELLTAEYGRRVPSSLIVRTVAAAWTTDGHRAEATARTDVAALAEAVDRSSAADGRR